MGFWARVSCKVRPQVSQLALCGILLFMLQLVVPADLREARREQVLDAQVDLPGGKTREEYLLSRKLADEGPEQRRLGLVRDSVGKGRQQLFDATISKKPLKRSKVKEFTLVTTLRRSSVQRTARAPSLFSCSPRICQLS